MAIDRSYDSDLALWAEDQARALRRAVPVATNLAIDWVHVAKEIESLGKSQARELGSRINVILVHLMKLQASPAVEPRSGWRETIIAQRNEITRLLEDSPSLRETVTATIGREMGRAAYQATAAVAGYGETGLIDPNTVTYTAEQVLGDWFPA